MKKSRRLRNILICIAFAVLLLFVKDNVIIVWDILCAFSGILTPFIVGFLIAYILNFPYKFFYNKAYGRMGKKHKACANMRKPLAIVSTYASVVAVLVILLLIVVPQIVINISNLITNMPDYFESSLYYLNDGVAWANTTFNANINLDNSVNELMNEVSSYFTADNILKLIQTAGSTTSAVWGFLSNTVGGVYNFVMGVIISVYFLSAKEQLCRQIKKLAVAFIPIKYLPKIYEIIDITDTKCGRFLVGDIIDAAVVGVLHFLVLAILHIPYAPLIAVLVGITNLIPFFGPFIGSIPSCFILLLINPWDMLWFLVVNIIIQQVDGNFIKPKILGSQVGLSSFWVLFSVIVGGAMFGVIGLLLGTPIFAVIYYLVSKRTRIRITDKGKIAQEALDFEVLNYAKIAAEQKRIREEKENQQREKLRKLIHFEKSNREEHSDVNDDSEADNVNVNDDENKDT